MSELVDPIRPSVPLTSGSPLERFGRGLTYPLRGLRFLRANTQLIGWAVAPMFITLVMITGAAWLTWTLADDLVQWLWPRPENGLAVLWWFVVNSLRLALFVVSVVVFWVVGNMLSSPFYDVMAEKTEALLLDRPEQPFDWRIVLGDAWLSIRHSALGLGMYIVVMVLLFSLNLIPGIGSALYTVLSWTASVFFVAREMMDIPLSRRRTPFRDKLRWMSEHKALLAGLGSSCMLLLMVPLVDLVVMPVAVMGGTLLFVHLDGEGAGVPQRGPTTAPRA